MTHLEASWLLYNALRHLWLRKVEVVSCRIKDEAVIEIDGPLEGFEHHITQDGQYGWCEAWNCKMVWRLKGEA